MSNDTSHPFQSEAHYGLLRAKLLAFLDRRSCTASDEVADEALMRLVKRAKIHEIANVDATAYAIAKHVFQEWLRKSGRLVGLDLAPAVNPAPVSDDFRMIAETVLQDLSAGDREFLEQYYIDGKKAKDLASQLGMTQVAVRSRAFRLRQQLQVVVCRMLAKEAPVPAWTPSSIS